MSQEQLSKFEALRLTGKPTISGILPATAQPIGRAMMVSAVDADSGQRTFAVATNRCDGFTTRQTLVAGTFGYTDKQIAFGMGGGDNGLETPFTGSKEGSLEQIDEMICEGTDYLWITSGDEGRILPSSPGVEGTPAKLSLYQGKFRLAQTADIAEWVLLKQLTPIDDTATDKVRILIQRVNNGTVPYPLS
jgi:hypothetical protein